jgi:hypothetical protein
LRDSHPKRPGTAASCGPESPIHEGISTEKKSRQVDFEKVNAEKFFVVTSSQGKGKGLVRKIVESLG